MKRFSITINSLLVGFEGRLLDQDVSHRFDVLVAIISTISSFVTTRVGVIEKPSSAKPNSGVAAVTDILIVSNDANSRLRVVAIGA